MSDKIKLSYEEINELLKTIAYLNTFFVITNPTAQHFKICKPGQEKIKFESHK